MAQYEINFSTNASSAAVQLSKLEREIANVAKAGRKVTIDFGLNNTTSISRMERELRRLQGEAARVAPNTADWVNFQQQIGRVSLEIGKVKRLAETIQLTESLGALAPSSLASLENRLTILRNRAREIAPEAKDWKAINKEIQDLERGIERINRKPLTLGQRAGAAGGAFLYGGGLGGGIGSALGGIAGGLAGGFPGAFAGAALGQAADNLSQYAAGIAQLSAQYNKSRIALAGVTSDQQDFNKAIEASSEIGQKFLLPLSDATKQFTKLQASVRGAGYDTDVTVKAFNGIASAIVATGGSTEDLNGALLAVSQVFSKGKVSAEELRQQIGERLAGAFTIFADSSGMAAKALDDLLSKGEVTLDDFIKFLEELNKRYGDTAEILANAPENAGPRLQVALQAMSLAYGGFFQKVGAGFQAYATDLVNFTLENQAQFKKIVASVAVMAQDIYTIFDGLIDSLIPPLTSFFKFIFDNFSRGINALAQFADESRRAAGGPEQRAARAVEQLYPNPVERALKGAAAYQEALGVELARDRAGAGAAKTFDQRVTDMANKMFAPYQPSKFGTALSGKSAEQAAQDQAKADKQKEVNLEAFERLRDQLADAYNRAEIERIKARYDLEKRLREDLFDIQELGANRLQRQNLQFLRALVTAEQERFEANLEARLNVAQEAGKVDQATSAFAMGKGTASGGAIFGATGRVFNAPGWVHGHFQNQNREALVQDTVEVVMGLIARGVSPELGSGARFGSKMSPRQIEALVRRGVASHKQYASGIGAVDIFVPAGTQVPTPVSGVQNLGGAAGVTGTLPRGTQLMHLDPRSRGLAGAPRKVGSNEARDTLAAYKTELAETTALEVERNSALVRTSDQLKALAQYAQDAYNVPDLLLDTQLQKKRNDLIEAGTDENIIDYEIRLYEIELQRQHLLKTLPNFIKNANLTKQEQADLEKKLADAFGVARQAEKEKNDETQRGLALQRNKEINDYIKNLQEEIALLRAVTEEERARLEIQQQYESATEEQRNQIYDLREIKKNLEEARRVIDEFVTGTTSDYKGFLKAVISGEDAKDALRQFQEGLRDRVLTIFLDFAMAPVEQFFQEQLKGIMNSLMPKTAAEDTPQTRNTTALEQNTEAIKANTTALAGGQAPAQQAQSQGASALPPSTSTPNLPQSMQFDTPSMDLKGQRRPYYMPPPVQAFPMPGVPGSDPAQLQNLSTAMGDVSSQMVEMTNAAVELAASDALNKGAASFSKVTEEASKAAEKAKDDGSRLGESLNKAVGAIGIAAGSIMGIAAGISQIKEGGTSNVLGGIGSIFMSLGGAIGGFTKLFAANGGIATGGWKPMPVTPFANGGMVTGPTLGLVGEGKYNEAIVPLPDGRSIPVEMRGASSARSAMETGGMPASTSPMLSLSFETTKIGGVEYVSRDQLELAMAATRREAIREGANRGMSMTIDKIKNSPSTRNSLGLRGR